MTENLIRGCGRPAADHDTPTPERVTLTEDEASRLVGDDIAFWVGNEFMSRDDLLGKVCWWVTRAAASREAEVRGQVKTTLLAEADKAHRMRTACLTNMGMNGFENQAHAYEHAARIAGGDQ